MHSYFGIASNNNDFGQIGILSNYDAYNEKHVNANWYW
jgi:hypothetical protein